MAKPKSIKILASHTLKPTAAELKEALEFMYGEDLEPDDFAQAKAQVAEHYAGLRLIILQVTPPDADIDFGAITQPVDDLPEENWQVPYDESPLDEADGTWAFFLHFTEDSRPLRTECGDLILPKPTPLPANLKARKKYDPPG